jgi:hypothetical protein
VLAGDYSRSYQDFGFKTVHGLLQSFYMFALSGTFLDWLIRRERRRLLLTLGLLAWPVMLINRGMFIWSVLELTAVYLILHRVRWRDLATIGLGVLAVVAVVGWVGDTRAAVGAKALTAVVAESAKPAFDVLPSGFLWVYVYATSPINNVVAAIDHIQPAYSFFYSTVSIFPTVLREFLFPFRGDERYALGLVASEFNTGTIYVNYLADWGRVGAVIVVAGIQMLATYFYLIARRGHLWAILGFTVFFQGVVLAGFTDSFAYLPGIAQVILALYFRASTSPAVLRRAAGLPPAVAVPRVGPEAG